MVRIYSKIKLFRFFLVSSGYEILERNIIYLDQVEKLKKHFIQIVDQLINQNVDVCSEITTTSSFSNNKRGLKRIF